MSSVVAVATAYNAAKRLEAIHSEPEFIAFLKTYNQNDSMQRNRLYYTLKYKTVKNIARHIFDSERYDIVDSYLMMYVDLNEISEDGESPMTHCIKKDYFFIFQKLCLSKDIKFDLLADTDEGSALIRATKKKSLFFVLTFCAGAAGQLPAEEVIRIVNLSRKALTNQTALYVATFQKSYNIMEILLRFGADPSSMLSASSGISLLAFATGRNSEIVVKTLLAYGADPAIATKNGRLPANIAKTKGYNIVERVLRRAMAKEALFTPAPVSPAASPLRYMFSQRGETCAPDAMSTLFFEADPIRNDFLASLEDPRLLELPAEPAPDFSTVEKSVETTIKKMEFSERDKTMEIFAHVIPRYKKMKSLERKPHSRRSRKKSLNAGEGVKMLECVVGAARGTGADSSQINKMIDAVLIRNSYRILKKNYNIATAVAQLGRLGDLPEFSKVFGIWLAFSFPIGVGHAVCMLKQDGHWFFGDNEVGMLHRFKDPDFPAKFYEGMKTTEGIQNLAYIIAKGRKTSSSTMAGYLCTADIHYPDKIGWCRDAEPLYPLGSAIVLYQTAPAAGGARTTRRRSRR